jgi:hypothetical protein
MATDSTTIDFYKKEREEQKMGNVGGLFLLNFHSSFVLPTYGLNSDGIDV